MPRTILVVDDSQLDRSLVGGLLRSNPDYRVELAENAKEALQRVGTIPVHLVLTDLVMPEMDGLELVRALRQNRPELPVILLTGQGNENIAVEALQAGAASYVPKAQKAERLMQTVARVLKHAEADRQGGRLAQSILECQCRLALENDPELIPPLLTQVHEMMANVDFADRGERIRVGEALEEAVLNAMYHGNLEISEQELAQIRANLDEARLEKLVQERQRDPKYRDRRVLVVIRVSPTEARIVVRDEGAGYRTCTSTEIATSNCFESGRHRGLTLIQTLMDEVRFNRLGNELSMSKRWPKSAGAAC